METVLKQDASVSVSMGLSSGGSDEALVGILDPNMTVKVLRSSNPMQTYLSGASPRGELNSSIFSRPLHQMVATTHTHLNSNKDIPLTVSPLNHHVHIHKKRFAYGTIELGEGDTFKIL